MTRRCLIPALFLATAVVPTTAMAVQSAELYRTQGYFYGRFEARVQFAPGSGVISSFFLWKDGSSSSTLWNELDYEKLNADCRMQTNAWTGMGGVQHAQINAMPGNICTGYHTYSFEWTPTYIAWFVDGAEVRRETGAIPADYATNASAGMKIHFNVWPGNASFGGAFSASILPVHEYISWVQYSSYVNGAFQLQWREEFDGTGIPSGWTEGNWASPYGLSTHNPANVNYVNGIAVLSLTADGATGFTGTPPADTAGTGGAATGGAGAGGTASGGAATGGITNRGGSSSVGGSTVTSGGTAATTGGNTASGGKAANLGGAPTGGTSLQSTGGALTIAGGTTGIVAQPTTGGAASLASIGGNASPGGTTTAAPVLGTPTDSGCTCRLAGRRGSGPGAFWLGILGMALLGRRRSIASRTG